MGTWNVQTLWVTGKLELLRNEIKRFRFDVIGISEVRWTGKGEISGGGFILPGEDTTHNRGVGMLLSARAKHTLIGYNPISSRVITARFHTTPFKLTVIQVYAPTPASLDDEIELFYDSIEHALTQTPKKDIVIVTGDWNAKFGSENTNWELVMGKYGYSDRNERGDRLTEFAALHSLYICNTRFQQKVNRNQTSPDGVDNNMIDLVLIQMRWKSSVTNFRTFQSADISSDHFLVLYNIKLRLKRRCIKPQQNRRPNNIYEKAQSAVQVEKETGEWFQTSVGSRQGDPLSPLLFITYHELVMDKVMQTNDGINISRTLVNNLRFADDIDVLEEDCELLHQQTEQIRVAAEEAALIMNTKKTKTLVFGDRNIEKHVQIAETTRENVEQFEYLGSLITWDNNCTDEIRK
ncbi:unnamed protein product [Rotaria socialis]|uniref:Endonuclease/exonuclease/phosphatase domain-containing protein n=1 Tax=Rotaria socialis TaxID=392032 RepID=A0A818JAL1_9BILA|nr:unnamed protein product [Rotaria socialis]